MRRWLPMCLALAWGVALWTGASSAQEAVGKKDDSSKSKESKDQEPVKDKEKPGPEKLKTPPGSILVLVEDLKDALGLFPKMYLLTPEQYRELQDRITRLEKQLKAERKSVHACKLSGKLEGDILTARAEFSFTTDAPRTTVQLGLHGAYLTDEGELDRAIPIIDHGDEGYSVRVEKEGSHQLTVNFKLPVALKRTTAPGAGAERAFELGLPGAAVTTLSLELPSGVKELRWNEHLEKQRVQNRWDLSLGKIKAVTVSWKEPISLPGNGPLLTAESQITLRFDETHAILSAEITLEDLRGQATEWQLLLPAGGRIDVKTPGSLAFDLVAPDGKNPNHVLKLKEPSTERIIVSYQARIPRPLLNPKVAVGPFVVVGGYRQQGTITVQAASEALRGRRLAYYRHGEIYQRGVHKSSLGDVLSAYQFWSLPSKTATGPAGVPLEVELRIEKGAVETHTDHAVHVRPGTAGWVIETTSRIRLKTPPAGVESLEVQLPHYRPVGLEALTGNPAAPFPAAVPWSVARPMALEFVPFAEPLGFACEGDLEFELGTANPHRRAQLRLVRAAGREFTVVITGKYLAPTATQRVMLELPRPLGTVDHGGKLTVSVDESLEFREGTTNPASVMPDLRLLQLLKDQAPETIEVAWRPRRQELAVSDLMDITVRDRSAQIRHVMSFTLAGKSGLLGSASPSHVQVHVPSAVQKLVVVGGGRLVRHVPDRELALLDVTKDAGGKVELILEYDFPLSQKLEADAAERAEREVRLSLIRLEAATRRETKVRVWTDHGVFPVLVEKRGAEKWKDRSPEIVPDRDSLPAMVLFGVGLDLPLAFRLREPAFSSPVSLVGERTLIQASVDEDHAHNYRARFLIRRLNTRQIEVELPVAAADCLTNVMLDQKKIPWSATEPNLKVARISVDPRLYRRPVVLEIEYRLPASFTTGRRFYQAVFFPPVVGGDAYVGRVRWQLGFPGAWIGAPLTASQTDWRWGLSGWLFGPEPSVSNADLENWFNGKDTAVGSWPVSMAFWASGQEQVVVFHMSRQTWLLVCSGLVLVVGLLLVMVPLSRSFLWFLGGLAGMGVLAVSWLWPDTVALLMFGCQPGLLVLIVILAVQWTVRQRYRRQVVFMPGFARLKPGSSLARKQGSGARPRDPTTADAPVGPAAASNTGA